jgi:hypothetical protein
MAPKTGRLSNKSESEQFIISTSNLGSSVSRFQEKEKRGEMIKKG